MSKFGLVGLGVVIGLIGGSILLAGYATLAHWSPLVSVNHGGMMGGGMMPGQSGMGGMMGQGRSQGVPTAAPDDNRPVDQTIEIVAQNMRYQPSRAEVRAGQTIRFVISNRDGYAHNFISTDAGISERVIAGGATQSVVWTAPASRGTYHAQCTYHPGMIVDIVVS